MPLLKGKSKKAFKHNVETEMKAGKPQDQSLAIAYNMKKKAPKKKMAEGGEAEYPHEGPVIKKHGEHFAQTKEGKLHLIPDAEHGASLLGKRVKFGVNEMDDASLHPLHKKKMAEGGRVNADDQGVDDRDELANNRGDKPAKQDSWTSRPDIAQSTRGPKTTAIKHPKMVPSSVFSTRLRGEEDDLQDSAGTNDGLEHQPPQHDDEEGADRQGTSPHKMKMMAEGGEINDLEPMSSAEQDGDEHPPGLESDNDMMGDEQAMNDHMTMLAEGGQAEMEADHHDSIAAAIMAKRGLKRLMQDSGSADEDAAEAYASGGSVQSGSRDMNYADGGQVDLKENSMEQPNGYYARNKAALKENYDEGMDDAHTPMDGEDGDEREDNRGNKKDKIEEMRKRAMSRRNFNK